MEKQFILNLFQAIDSSDWETLRTLFHDDMVYERPGYEPFEGRDRVMQFYQKERVLASGKHHLENIILEGDYGACCGRFIGLKKDGSNVDERFADVYFLADGKIRTRKSYFFRPAV